MPDKSNLLLASKGKGLNVEYQAGLGYALTLHWIIPAGHSIDSIAITNLAEVMLTDPNGHKKILNVEPPIHFGTTLIKLLK